MSAISNFINTIQNAVYGEQVRGAIISALEQCYSDVNAPSLQTEAFATALNAAYAGGILDIQTVTQISAMTNQNIIYRYNGTQAGYQKGLYYYSPISSAWVLIGSEVHSVSLANQMTDTNSIYKYTGTESGMVQNSLYCYNGTSWVPIGSGVLTASTAAQMTNTGAIYKYTGTESGYVTNVLYYYNGTAWVPISAPTDKTLSQENVSADAKATGDRFDDVDSIICSAPSFGLGAVLDELHESFTVAGKIGTANLVANERYSVSTGEIGTISTGGRTPLFPVVEGQSFVLHKNSSVTFFTYHGNFVSGTLANANDTTVSVPINENVALASVASTNALFMQDHSAAQVTTNKWVLQQYVTADDFRANVDKTVGIENMPPDAREVSKKIQTRAEASWVFEGVEHENVDILVNGQSGYVPASAMVAGKTIVSGTGEVIDSDDDTKGVATFVVKPNSSIKFHHQVYRVFFYDSSNNYLTETPYPVSEVRTIEVPSDAFYCRVFGSVATFTNPRASANQILTNFKVTKAYQKSDTFHVEWENVDNVDAVSLFMDTDVYHRIKYMMIRSANKMRQGLRVATFNIKGTGGNGKTRLSDIKTELQDHGIDLIGFQEVLDPLGENTDGIVFSEALSSWHLQEFSDSVSFQTNARIVAATGDFNFMESSETKYSEQANYGDRYFVKAEFELPMWKHKHWSEHIKVSVYNTQLEVGAKTTKLQQVAQLLAAVAEDTNPFIIIMGDFNEDTSDFAVFNAIEDGGYTPALNDFSTPTCFRGYYDNIFVNDRISVVGTDVIPYSEDGSNLSDHDMFFADLVFDYSHIIGLKLGLVNCHVENPTEWLDNRQTEPVSFTVVPDDGYTLGTIDCGHGDYGIPYNNGAVTKNGSTVTITPNLVIGDAWINCTATEST